MSENRRRRRVVVLALEVGSARAFACLRHDPRLACVWFAGPDVAAHVDGPDWRSLPIELDGADGVLLSSATGRETERAATHLARAKGWAVVHYLDTWGPFDHRVGPPAPDAVGVVDDLAARDAASVGIDPERIDIVGQPAWESLPRLEPAPCDVVAFLSQPIRARLVDRLGYDEADAWSLIETARRQRPDLVRDLIAVGHPNADAIEAPKVDLAPGLARAGTVIGMYSSAMVDAVAAGRRVISLQPTPDRPDRCGLSRAGVVPLVRDLDGLIEALANARHSKADHGLSSYSGSAKRLADLLLGTRAS